MKKKNFINYCGLLGVVAFLSYTAAVVFSPLAYPGYNWMAQAVSDLSASNAPSLRLWNQLSSLYNVCTLVCAMMVCLGIQKKGTRLLRSGIYLFTIMEWVSAVGFGMFPLSEQRICRNISGSDAYFVNGNRCIVIYHITDLNHYFRDKKQKLSFLWDFCRNSTWNDDRWCIWYEYCSERVFWNS